MKAERRDIVDARYGICRLRPDSFHNMRQILMDNGFYRRCYTISGKEYRASASCLSGKNSQYITCLLENAQPHLLVPVFISSQEILRNRDSNLSDWEIRNLSNSLRSRKYPGCTGFPLIILFIGKLLSDLFSIFSKAGLIN